MILKLWQEESMQWVYIDKVTEFRKTSIERYQLKRVTKNIMVANLDISFYCADEKNAWGFYNCLQNKWEPVPDLYFKPEEDLINVSLIRFITDNSGEVERILLKIDNFNTYSYLLNDNGQTIERI